MDNSDRFTNLEKSIFHRILSFLDMKDVARVSSLSMRCLELCLSTPFLNIVVKNFHDRKEISRFWKFIKWFLLLHRGVNNNNIDQLKVEICCENLGVDVGIRIEQYCINVRKVFLVLHKIEFFTMSEDVLGSESLREVNLCHNGRLILPTSTKFGGLVNLTLKHLMVLIGSFGEWISSCKTLKMLHLIGVAFIDEKLNITSSSLEDLIIEHVMEFCGGDISIKVSAESLKYLRIVWPGDPRKPPEHSLTLHAPNLQKLSWGGLVSHYSFEGNFESLRYSDISILPTSDSLPNEIIPKAIQTISRVSSICITDYSVKAISSRSRLPQFHNLHSLTLIRTGLPDEITSRVALLNSMPNLNALKIGLKLYGYSSFSLVKTCYNAEYWESQNLEFVHSLKEVEMEIKGKQDELELIKYLLNNAKALKKMTIHYSSRGFHKDSLMCRKIQQFQIASPFISIFLLQM